MKRGWWVDRINMLYTHIYTGNYQRINKDRKRFLFVIYNEFLRTGNKANSSIKI